MLRLSLVGRRMCRRDTAPTVPGADTPATLAWSTPSAEGAATAEQTEDLESATGWSSEVDGWTLLDLDKGSIGGIGNKQLPVSGQQPFFVMDDQHAAFLTPTAPTTTPSRPTAATGTSAPCTQCAGPPP